MMIVIEYLFSSYYNDVFIGFDTKHLFYLLEFD